MMHPLKVELGLCSATHTCSRALNVKSMEATSLCGDQDDWADREQ